jgi:N-acetylneuraminic acid mutarotase
LATVEAYDPASNSWKEIHSMLYKRGDMAVGVMGGNIFSIAGETKDSNCQFSVPVSNVGRYNIIDNTWQLEQCKIFLN